MDLTEVDPAVAGACFTKDLDQLWASGQPARREWRLVRIDDLTVVIEMPARSPEGALDPYYIRLHASHYGPHPPQARFVQPDSWQDAPGGSRWLPRLEDLPGWFALHATYGYAEGPGQLICFSFNLDYYRSNHTPEPSQVWTQGRHTVAATLNRIHEMLGPAHYRGPAGPVAEAA